MKKYMPKNKIPLFKVFMAKSVLKPLNEVVMSGYIGQGSQVDTFETKIASFINNRYVFSVNSGTMALQIALRLANVGYGDEVISTPMTCTATNWPILGAGARISWADIDPTTGNIDPESIRKRLTKKTKAIMVVDWGGYPCDIAKIRRYAGDIPIIEDAAHAFGSRYKNKMVGNAADFTCFSFQAIKHLTTVDGGAVAVKNKSHYDRGILLRWYGIDRKTRSQEQRIEVDVAEYGYKGHMNDVAATIGLENIKFTHELIKKHRLNADFYKKNLAGLKYVKLLKEHKGYDSTYWLFTILVTDRDAFSRYMADKNIMVSQVHRRNDTHPAVKMFKRSLPNVDKFTSEMVCIPVGWWLTEAEREHIAYAVRSYTP